MSLPTDFGTGTVTGHWVTSRGLNGRGQVVFTPRANFMVSGATETIVLPTPVVATLRDGAISVVLPATDDPHITPVDWTWKVECNIDGLEIAAFDIAVPEGSTQDLSTVVEVDPGTGTTITTGPTGPAGPAGPAGPQPDLSDAPPEALGVASPGVDAEASRSDHVHPLPSPGDVGAATAAQGSLADSAVQPGDLATVATSGDYDDLSNKPTIPPAAPVDSVNGETGVVVLDAGDVGAVPTARTITAGTGLTGGGDLSADRTLTVTYGATAGTAAEGNDARLTNARTPTAHAASHQDGGSDELALDGSQITSGTVDGARLPIVEPSYPTGVWPMFPTTPTDLTFDRRFAWWVPTRVRAAVTVTGIAVLTHTTPASAGAVWRLGIYTISSAGKPGALVIDGGTVPADVASTWCEVTISQALTPGWYAACVSLQGATTDPTVRAVGYGGGVLSIPKAGGTPSRGNHESVAGWRETSANGVNAGPLPASPPALAATSATPSNPPVIWFRTA